MAPYIEANSLSDITQLASNPPKYPRNPTERKRDPLTLYIARVPGSRDIILTTLKPQLKNVTLEDVASSLYYFHLNSDDDAQLLPDDCGVIVEEDEPAEKAKPLSRKRLPESSKFSIDLDHQPPYDQEPPSTIHRSRKISRKALSPSAQVPDRARDPKTEQVQSKPLGPRPLLSEPSLERDPFRGAEPQSPTSGIPTQHVGGHPNISTQNDHWRRSFGSFGSYNAIAPLPKPNKGFSITVIRRDPSSGAQWNVGTVLGEQQTQSSRSKKSYFDISVLLTTLGYTQFREPQINWNTAKGKTGTGYQAPSLHLPHNDVQLSPEQGFHRQICMEGSSFWDRPKQHKLSGSDISDIQNTTYRSSISPDSIADANYSQSSEAGSKGYAFTSPWAGRCKFTTSGSGRTLRCKHTLPGPVSTGNSLDSGPVTQPVSELRFNLPSSNMFHNHSSTSSKDHTTVSGRFQIPKLGHIRNKLSPDKLLRPSLPPRPHLTSYASMYPSGDGEDRPPLPPRTDSLYETKTSDDDSDESPPILNRNHRSQYTARSASDEGDRLDLSIGQEKAGGGNRGKRVKLGKLIVLDEGYKMLDLVVAANLGVWWSVWESSN